MELGEWNQGQIFENLDNRRSDNRSSTVFVENNVFQKQKIINGNLKKKICSHKYLSVKDSFQAGKAYILRKFLF